MEHMKREMKEEKEVHDQPREIRQEDVRKMEKNMEEQKKILEECKINSILLGMFFFEKLLTYISVLVSFSHIMDDCSRKRQEIVLAW